MKNADRRRPYFDAHLQIDANEYKRLVCFSLQKRQALSDAEASNTPVVLKQIDDRINDYTKKQELVLNEQF